MHAIWTYPFWSTDVQHRQVFASICMTSGNAMDNINNSLRPRQKCHHIKDDIFKCISMNETGQISLNISPKFGPQVRNNNIPALVQIMAWGLPGDKPLSVQMMVRLLTHICVTRPHWSNKYSQLNVYGEEHFLYQWIFASYYNLLRKMYFFDCGLIQTSSMYLLSCL